jgi:hypothetical protein
MLHPSGLKAGKYLPLKISAGRSLAKTEDCMARLWSSLTNNSPGAQNLSEQ